MSTNKKVIIITGASSGLGKALAIQYANESSLLFLFGRSSPKLEEVASICRSHHAKVSTIICDVQDTQKISNYIENIATNHKIDIVISCAGVSAGTLTKPETFKQVEKIFSTNLNGSLNVIMHALPSMVKHKHGSIVIISSMAGLIGLSSAPAYSASKAAVKIFGDGLRAYLKQFHIQVSVVIPGYIDTPMTAINKFPMPFKISASDAAKIIVKKVSEKHGLIVFPKLTYFALKLINLLPYGLIDYINAKLPGKPAFNDSELT